jgi:hypothetical protein
MKRTAQLAFAALAALLLAACGGVADRTAAHASETFAVRPAGTHGRLVAYDAATGARRFSLPAGIASADGRRYYTASRGALLVFDPSTGARLGSHPLAGAWKLGGVSPSGRWVVLAARNGPQTKVRVLDSEGWRVARDLDLRGDYEVDTISADGSALFLIQHLPGAGHTAYIVWLYDLRTGNLSQPGEVRAKGTQEVMTGYAWSGLASPDGHWLLTLYLNTQRDVAFVHALDLRARRPVCIDLPSGSGRLDLLKSYTLALQPDGRTLLAANPALGVVAEVDLDRSRVVRAAPLGQAFATVGLPEALLSTSALAPDGHTLYVTSGSRIWAYDSASQSVRGPIEAGEIVSGLAVSRDGKQLFAVGTNERVSVVKL